MWHSWGGGNGGFVRGGEADDEAAMQQPLVAVAVDKDKGSQTALKWTLDNLVTRGQTIMLLHVFNNKPAAPPRSAASSPAHSFTGSQEDAQMKEVFLPFRCFCSLKQVNCKDVALEDTDVAKAIVEFVAHSAIEKLVVGHSSKNQFLRFKSSDIPHAISKGAPDFCTVYVIHKGKVSSERTAVRQAPATSLLKQQLRSQNSTRQEASDLPSLCPRAPESPFQKPRPQESIRSPFCREGNSVVTRSYGDLTASETDVSFVSSGRPSIDRIFPSVHHQYPDSSRPPRLSDGSDFDRSFDLALTPQKRSVDGSMFSTFSNESGSTSWSSQAMDEVEAEMRRLRLELKQTMDMYSTACKEALTANQKAKELHRWKVEEEQRLQEALLSEEAALAIAETEKAKCRAAIDAAEAAQRLAQLEAHKRINAETKALREAEEKKRALDALALGGGGGGGGGSGGDLRYRKYTIKEIEAATDYFAENRQIGEGGYGPVYKGRLDHTPVAIKVLRSNAAQGRSQFQQEVEVLSCIRHPNMVLLLGACPEYGCLVYEYMANGSLDDRLFRRGNTPALPWQVRFRIAAEICTGLLFLHQTKPEPLVHRDLKPANILLDRNNVSKISDVGLARLVPPSVADNVTQYRMTSTAGTFCYIDPEYQQTGMLGVKSDIYSLGILLLQLLTARSPMGLTHHVERAIEKGTFREMLDPAVPDWPLDKALALAKAALSCAELRRKDRPDLGAVVLPIVDGLRDFADANQLQDAAAAAGCLPTSANHSQTSISYDVLSDPQVHASYESSIRSYAPYVASLGK